MEMLLDESVKRTGLRRIVTITNRRYCIASVWVKTNQNLTYQANALHEDFQNLWRNPPTSYKSFQSRPFSSETPGIHKVVMEDN